MSRLVRLREIVILGWPFAAVAIVLAGAGAVPSKEPDRAVRPCGNPGCMFYDHSPEAWAKSQALQRLLERGEAAEPPVDETLVPWRGH